MLIVTLAWMYVVLMMAVAEATSPQGTLLGAIITFLLYGVVPLSILLYIMATPGRRRAHRAREEAAAAASSPPDGGGMAAGDGVAAERKEP